MIGIAFFLHFGVLHLLALVWRTAGVNATPIMNAPILAQSLSEFWGKRWNLAFRDLVHRFVFRPVFGRLGVAGATMAVFLVSGLIHEFVISLSSGAAYGLPTLYFLIQGVGVLSTRSRLGKRWGLGKGLAGRASVVLIMVAPLGLLFPPPFVLRVVVPMLQTLAV
jgi:D-alanyl-lipoteichoic acid acyltransferase DltB (MBOAT superfamily)